MYKKFRIMLDYEVWYDGWDQEELKQFAIDDILNRADDWDTHGIEDYGVINYSIKESWDNKMDMDVIRIARFELEQMIEEMLSSTSKVELADKWENAQDLLMSLNFALLSRINS